MDAMPRGDRTRLYHGLDSRPPETYFLSVLCRPDSDSASARKLGQAMLLLLPVLVSVLARGLTTKELEKK